MLVQSGKCPPEPSEFAVVENSFNNVELYLETQHLGDSFEETVQYCQQTPLNVVSVHTPHVTLDESRYLQQADELADILNAYLVVHSTYIRLNRVDDTYEAVGEFRSSHGFENGCIHSAFFCEQQTVLRDIDFVLDVGHLSVSERDYLAEAERLLTEYGDSIEVVHLCDETFQDGNLAFGEGHLDMEQLCSLIKEHHSGIVVFEVMPEHQAEAREFFESV